MNKKSIYKVIIAIAVALTFVLPTSAVFVNDEGTLAVQPVMSILPSTQTVEKDGNKDVTATFTTEEDTIPPVTEIILDGTMGNNGWYVSVVTVTLVATDEGSGVESTWYRLNSGYWKFYTVPIKVSSEGEHTVEYYSVDDAGNREYTKTRAFKIDKISASTEHDFDGVIGDDGWFVSDVTVTLSASDATSDVNYTMYKIDDGDWITYVNPFIVTDDGEYFLCYYSVDLAGNVEPTNDVDFKIDHDTEPPVTTHVFEGVMGDNDWYISEVTVTLNAKDDSSGVDYTMYKPEDDTEWQEYIEPILVTEDGEHTIKYYSVDNVENKEAYKGPFDFKIDQTVPTINLTWDGENSKIIADVFDETSGVNRVEFYVNGELVGEVTEAPYKWEVTKPKRGDMGQAIVFDNASNEAISEEITPQNQSHSQSSSSILLPLQILSRLLSLW